MSSRKKKKTSARKKRGRPPRHVPLNIDLPPNTKVISTPAGEAKMSEVLLEFLEPYSEFWGNEDQMRKLITLALVAWNAALAPPENRDVLLRDTLEAVPPDTREGLKVILGELMRRKWSHFADNKRVIFDYQLTMTPSGPYLQVVSMLPNSFTPGPRDIPR